MSFAVLRGWPLLSSLAIQTMGFLKNIVQYTTGNSTHEFRALSDLDRARRVVSYYY